MPIWLGFLWTMPNTLLGVIVGLCTFQMPRIPLAGRLSIHERHHIKQYCALGPLFIPVYLGLAIPYGYRRHPMEISAMRAAGELPTQDAST